MDGSAAVRHAATRHSSRIARHGAYLEGGPVLLIELGNQTGFPREVLLHGLAISGVAVVNEKKVVDAFRI